MDDTRRFAWAEIDLEAIAHNVGVLRGMVSPAAVWVVVKADGYGHGAVEVALAALNAGAEGLCVALVAEGVVLRQAGVSAPVLVLSHQPEGQFPEMVDARLIPTLYDLATVASFASAVRHSGCVGYPVQVKIDTGMHRVGCAPEDATAVVAAVASEVPTLRLAGVYTHLACADTPAHQANADQLARFDATLEHLAAQGTDVPFVHAANSAAAMAIPASRHDMVRSGIAVYGVEPGPGVAGFCAALRPALALKARVSFVRRVPAGDRISYGLRHRFARDTKVATVPIGYADGVRRSLWQAGATVLIGGHRRPIVGVVTMDQLMVDVGDDEVSVGDEVVLIGKQGAEAIRVEEWADRADTIGYEIICGISARIPRRYR